MRAAVGGALLLSGCVQDPQMFGYWDIVSAERGGVVQRDTGFLEIRDDSKIALFLRYLWDGNAFVPDPAPTIDVGQTDASKPDDPFDSFRKKGETYQLTIDLFGTFDLVDYRVESVELAGDALTWPGRPEDELLPTSLSLTR